LSTFLNDVYQSVLRRQKNLGNTNILIKKEIERIDEYADCYTDFQKLKHIFLNILGNALKFTPEGFVNFGVFLSDDGANYVFFVKDTGIGIPKEMHETIFEKFRIADESLTRKYGGIGAGLFICKRLITLLNGKIWIESQENKGSTFYFSIPK
jgi:signal transduction histidine kinase